MISRAIVLGELQTSDVRDRHDRCGLTNYKSDIHLAYVQLNSAF